MQLITYAAALRGETAEASAAVAEAKQLAQAENGAVLVERAMAALPTLLTAPEKGAVPVLPRRRTLRTRRFPPHTRHPHQPRSRSQAVAVLTVPGAPCAARWAPVSRRGGSAQPGHLALCQLDRLRGAGGPLPGRRTRARGPQAVRAQSVRSPAGDESARTRSAAWGTQRNRACAGMRACVSPG